MANEEQKAPATAGQTKPGLFERNPGLRTGLRVLVVVLVIAAVAYWWYGRSFEDTDDAQVDGHIYPVSARINGHITKVNVEDGQFVKAGTVLAEIDDTDYKVAVERARADFMDATASAEAAGGCAITGLLVEAHHGAGVWLAPEKSPGLELMIPWSFVRGIVTAETPKTKQILGLASLVQEHP